MTTNQEGRQAAIRDSTSTAYGVAADWNALFDDAGISAGTFNERLLAWINAELSASYSNLVSAMQAYAEDAGYDGWEDMATLVLAMNGAETLLDGETQGLAFDFTDQSALIIDTGTPANNYDSTGIVSSGSLVGPSGKLTYTSPSNKLTRQSDGYYKYQAHNLLSNSTLAGAVSGSPGTAATGWSFVTVGTPSVDAVTALETGYNSITITCDAERHVLAQTVTTIVGATYSVETDVVADGNIVISQILGLNTFPTTYQYYFNDVAKTLSDTPSGAGVIRLEWTATATSHSFRIGAGSSASCTGTVTVSAPLFRRTPSNSDKIRTTTSGAKYALPIEYDTSGNCLGLLVEEARTNLQTYSTFSTGWTPASNTITAASATSPAGVTDAALLLDDSGGGTGSVYALRSNTVTAATAYTISCFAKAAGLEWCGLGVAFMGSLDVSAYFHLSGSGSTGTLGADATSSGIESVGNGWYRCWVTFTSDAADTAVSPLVRAAEADATPLCNRDGTSSIYVWCFQLEAGSFPTSPIITYGSTATRAADQKAQLTSTFPLSATAGSLYAYVVPYAGSDLAGIVSLNDGSGNEEIVIYKDASANIVAQVEDGGVGQLAPLDSTVNASSNTAFKVALAWAANDFALSANGTAAQTDTGGTLPTVTTLEIGVDQANNYFNGIIKAIAYWPRRRANSELQTVTT